MRIVLCVAPLLTAALGLSACVKERKTEEVKTSKLIPHYMRTVSIPDVICDAYFTDDTGATVTLEEDAIMTCNGNLMTRSGANFSGSTPYEFGAVVSISLIRPVDGTNMTDSEKVF
jgi:hypothetical protein